MSSNLGRTLSTHRGTFSAGGMLWYVGAILVASGVVSFVQPSAGMSASEAAITGVAGLIAGAGCLFAAFSRLRQSVEVFEQGFVWTRVIGTTSIARADIADAKVVTVVSRKRGTSTKVVVSLRNGRELKINGVEHPAQLANFLRPTSGIAPAVGSGAPAFAGGWIPPGT